MKQKTKQLQTFILSLMMLVMGTAGAWGEATVWKFGASPTSGTIGEDNTVTFASTSGPSTTMTYKCGSGDALTEASATIGDVSYTYYLKQNGKVSEDIRVLSFPAPSASGTLTIVFAGTASGSIDVKDASADTKLATITPSASTAVTTSTLSTTVGNTIQIYSTDKKSYIYSVIWTPSGSTPTLSSIAVETAPTKTTYTANETFDPAGLVIRKTMSDSSTEDVDYDTHTDDFTFTPNTSAALNASNTSVTITYGGKSTSQEITVNRISNTLALSTTSGSMTVGDNDKNISGYITSKNNTGTTVTYSSDAEGVATVSSSGAIHAVSAGTAHITVAQAQTNVYTAGSATYTVTVSAAAPTYSVTYHNNLAGASGSVTDGSTYEAGASVKTQANNYSKSGYTFLGWSTSSGYQSSYTTAGNNVTMVAGGLDLYAQWQIDGSISSSPASGSSVVSGQAVTTTATSTAATGMKYNQGANAYTVADLIASGGSVGSKTLNWTLSQNAIGAHIFSAVLTDGTFYSAVLTQNYTIGAAAPVISCSGNTVTITSATNLAEIRYTTDGTEPTNESALYSAPFPIGENTTVKAIAIKSGSTSATTTQVCEYGAADTSLPVTFNFTTSPWSTSTDFSGAVDDSTPLTILDSSNNHNISFYGNKEGEFSIKSGSPNSLQMTQNGSINHFIAIPISGINSRLEIDVWAPYTKDSKFTIRAALDTSNGTAVQNAAPGAIKEPQDVNKYDTDHFNFRMNEITATSGVLYLGVNSSSFQNIQKITVSTLAADNLIKAPGEIIVGDGNTATVTIKNYSATKTMKLVSQPSYVSCTFSPSSGELIVTPTAIGSGENISIALEDDSSPVLIPVTVKGITSVSSDVTSAVYEYGATADALSVTAAKSSNLGNFTYTWYKNTVNSTTGGVVVKTESKSGTTSTYTPSTTLAAEDASFYYCEVSVPGDTIQTKTSNVAYVLTSSTGRYFQMSNVAGNKSTSETSIEVTGQKIAGGKATFRKDGTTKYYVLRPDGYGHYYHLASSNSFKVELSKAIAAGDVISAKVQGLGQSIIRGIWISDSDSRPGSAPASQLVTSDRDTEVTKTYTVQAGDAIVGKTTIYIYGNTNSADYFTDLIIYTPGDVKISNPASQTIQEGETPTPLTVTASDGSGPFSFLWQKKVGDGDWTNVTTPTDGTVATNGATSTFQPVALTATTSYKCTVTDNTTTKTAMSEAAVITVNEYSHGYYTPSFGGSNTVIYVLNKTNYDGQNKTGTDRKSYTNYWQYTGSVSFETQTIKDISEDAAKYPRLRNNSASITFDVKDATAFIIYAGNGNNSSRTFDILVDGTKVGTQIQNLTWGNLYAINQSGSRITITNASGDNVYIDAIKFYKAAPAIITIKKDNVAVTEATQYIADDAVDYAVETNSGGTFNTPTSSNESVATATYSEGVLTVTPVAKGTATITLHQNAETGEGATYIENDAKLIVNVKNYAVNMSFSYTSVEIKKSDLTPGNSIASSKLPTLTITHEDGTANAATIKWLSDETSIATVPDNTGTSTDYTVTYGSLGLSGGVRIYAYVEDTGNYGSASAYFDLVVKDGTPNKFEKAGESIKVQQQYTLANTSGVPVVTITYGGYKYLTDKTGKWSNTAVINKNHDYSIDGYKYYSSYEKDDATAEYTYTNKESKARYYNLKGMRDDWNANSMDSDGETPADAYPDGMWYKTEEVKPQGGTYAEYERIRPLALPCRGSYLKFEPKKSGVLTAYVVQNGVIGRGDNSNQLASKPRLGYWFDQDGWVQQPTVEPVAKQPILEGDGIDSHVFEGRNLRQQMDYYWTSEHDDDDMITLLTNKWISVEKPNRTTVKTASFSNEATKPAGYYDNPYYWGTNEEVKENLDKIPAPTNITPVPYHNGYLVPEKCYVKYTLNVVAGKTYYFYGMMTKVGYVGLNFVEAEEDGTGALTTSGFTDFSHETERLDLKADDNWSTIFGTGAGSKLKNGENTIYDEVTLPSHYRVNKWNTICLPFALSENQVEAAFGTGTQLAIYNGLRHDTDKHIYYVKYLRHVDQNILPGQPYLIYPTGTGVAINDGIIGTVIGTEEGAPDNNKRITFSNVVVEKDKLNQATANYGNNKDVDGVTESFRFTPTYSPVQLEKYSLFYSPTDGKLYRWMKDGGTFATYRAYMKPKSDEVTANSLSFGFSNEDIENTWEENGTDGQETSVIIIEEIGGGQTMISNTSNGKAYNMMGQEVDPTSAKGIVIINGKKYMFN